MPRLRTVVYVDEDGRKHSVQLRAEQSDADAERGIPLGPPPLDGLGLALDVEVRLHNQLHDRGLLSHVDVRRRRLDVQAALQAALSLDVDRIVEVFSAPPGGK